MDRNQVIDQFEAARAAQAVAARAAEVAAARLAEAARQAAQSGGAQ
ncbi:hypothetical protein ACGFY6_33405 [Streptomyces sp. NPDC048387]